MVNNKVLIVPLWNWNSVVVEVQSPNDRSNRTFMELKLKQDIIKIIIKVGSNRTFMALKFGKTPLK